VDTSLVTNPAPQQVYNSERWGPAAWTIPGLNPKGGYNVRLHFVEFAHDAAGLRNFNVSINGEQVLTNFDIYQAAGAEFKAVTEEFYTEADENGIIEIETNLGTSTVTDLNPTVNAIEIIPATASNPVGATPGTTTSLSINSGGAAESNSGGGDNSFVADEMFNGGDTSTTTNTVTVSGVANAAPMAVYQSERYVPFTYVLTGLEADATYTVNLHFAETYWTAAGKRIFSATINGAYAFTDLDVYATAGANKALVKQYTANADMYGQIIVQLIYGGADQPFINGIEAIKTASSCNAVPAVPTGLNPTATSDTSIELTWTGVSTPTGCTGVTYNVYGGTTANPTTQIASGLTTTSYSNTGLAPSTTYYYTVKAVDTDGSSAASTQASTKTPAASCAADTAAPTALTVTSTTSSAIGLSWTAPTPPTNCTVSSYIVYGGTAANPTTQVGTSTGTTTTISGLTTSTTYYFTVAAVDGFGTSPASAQVSDKTSSGGSGSDFIAIAAGGPAESDAGGGDANFVADEDYSGGGDNTHTTHTINLTQPGANAAPMGVYQYGRAGVTTYTIPGMVAGSSHSVLLHFSENYYSAAGKRVFNVAINGTSVLSDFDIYKTAGAEYTAVEETFTATANSSGDIVIAFTDGTANQPLIMGIEIR
jgi:hypothetical protein